MLYVRVEMWPRGDRENARLLHEAFVWNDGRGTAGKGSYQALLSRKGGFTGGGRASTTTPKGVWRRLALGRFPRLRLNAWNLLARLLEPLVQAGFNRARGAPERLWLPAADWEQGRGQASAPWIRASFADDAWSSGPNEGGKSLLYRRADAGDGK